ncbi:hypothetical protein CYLTODRAFT_352200 [Cylindrobasidium torrendii FP15055 ss-10]|uniref:Uncharacterized protein n=1 Tax=Cylindrobasidium torrendii FP15055 ss-10 TaxID=1314674 RepID=A0A0D7BCF0_9AGAR|nr:hypothetical protein CYLTODRAFT_352200 [Cylindrobasidium torrendii FP15055 ss-10]
MPSTLPSIITLPHGRCPPLHIMAPTWRHLLKLMARLAGTRVEPTVEALAQTKDVLRLRVVVQFTRNPPERQEWCTVLWFTVDHPVPPDLPATAAFSSTDTLPFSYTTNLTHMNALLRSGVDTATSKLYTIPATATVPYPTLPISFPNLALYLQAALDEARRTDKRLARMVDTCFPTYTEPPEVEQQGKVGGLFRKALGKRKNKPQQARTANEDTYDLVTPFMSDEWG